MDKTVAYRVNAMFLGLVVVLAGVLFIARPAQSATPGSALVTIDSGGDIGSSSTWNPDSFKVKNTSADENISKLTIDLGATVLPDMVFDPQGQAGDSVAKCLQDNSDGAPVGFVAPADPCVSPFSEGTADHGYEQVTLEFTDFGPGEEFTFSVDVDPNSIKGQPRLPNIDGAGSVSGLELAGAEVDVFYANGSTTKDYTFRSPNSATGSKATVKAGGPPTPGISVAGVEGKSKFKKANQSVLVEGPAGANVSVVVVEGKLDLDKVPNGGYDIDPYEANSAVSVDEKQAKIGANGSVEVPVTLTDAGGDGLNYIVAAAKGSSGETGTLSNVVVAKYDPSYNQAPVIKQIADQKSDEGEPFSLQVEATDPDGDSLSYSASGLPAGLAVDKDTGEISGSIEDGAHRNGPYNVTVTASDGTDSDTEGFAFEVPDTEAPETTLMSGPSGLVKFKSAQFAFSSTEDGATFECALDGSAFGPCASPATYKGLADGRHTFAVRSVDASGNADATPAARAWRVDATKPVISPLWPKPGSAVKDRTPSIRAKVIDSATELRKGNIKLYVDGRRIYGFNYNASKDHLVWTSSRNLAYGKHSVKVVAADAAANQITTGWSFRIVR